MNRTYYIHTCFVVGPFLSSLFLEELELSREELIVIRVVSLQRGGQEAGLRAGSCSGTKYFLLFVDLKLLLAKWKEEER